jgi:hypothetical protein
MNHTVTKQIDADDARAWQDAMDSDTLVEGHDPDGVLETFTFQFPGTLFEADIKVCNGDTGPWIDAVLFHNGSEVMCLDPGTTLLGEYEFEDGNDKFVAILEPRLTAPAVPAQ